ncbi:hypothetical protein [Nafulsella turpanensis]|uniref:hypothetical protein n=1 Tax=Nafulsella turpanensis TaxID=1265690 RepID=UPI000346E7A1|nr:hypothetical protein [Nafulsella turpanensis]
MFTFSSGKIINRHSSALNMNSRLLSTGIVSRWQIYLLQLIVIIGFSLLPVFFNLPYRVNIFLSWEGAYRLYLGQIPFRDFGMPLGYGYFVVPALFFKLFGPYLFSLVYAQAFLNILTLLSLRSILHTLGVKPANVLLAILVMCLTFTFPINFWPWYNNSAFIYGMFGLNMLLLYQFSEKAKWKWLYLIAAGFFMAFSLFTKQDFGGLSFAFGLLLMGYYAWLSKDFKSIGIYFLGYLAFLALLIVPVLPYDFLYWFNYGQPPHDSRLHPFDLANSIVGGSMEEKWYLLLIGLLAFFRFKSFKELFLDKREGTFFILTVGLVGMAFITKVTSRLPADTSTYFHAFAFAYILDSLSRKQNTASAAYIMLAGFLTLFWWSGVFWKYAGKFLNVSQEKESSVSAQQSFEWALSDYKAFENVYMPKATIAGIERIKELDVVQRKEENLKVLNMSELTPLAHELGYEPLVNQPLWYHLNIGMFDQQVDEFKQKIEQEYYDLVLFEDIPSLTEFYPYEVREQLMEDYELRDRFLAPRALGDSYIEVYTRKK